MPEEELLIKDELERLADDDGGTPSSMSSRHSHEDDEDKMPEESFMKYTKDSRTGTPVPTGKPVIQEQDKKPINVDLRDETSDDKAVDKESSQRQSSSTPRRPAPRGPTIQKQRGPLKYL